MHIKIPKKQTESKKYVLQILGKEQVLMWMDEIGFNNLAKYSRYEIWQQWGFCPPNTSFEERTKLLNGELNPNDLCGPVA